MSISSEEQWVSVQGFNLGSAQKEGKVSNAIQPEPLYKFYQIVLG